MRLVLHLPTFLMLAFAVAGIALAGNAVDDLRFQSFTAFAGSESNLQSLVAGLRGGKAITLAADAESSSPETTTFAPPTKPMGYGNVRHALSLAQAELAAAGISNPTPLQIEAALMGGTLIGGDGKSVVLQGVVRLRSQGMGWGQIRQALGLAPQTFSLSARAGAGITTADGRAPSLGAYSRTGAGVGRRSGPGRPAVMARGRSTLASVAETAAARPGGSNTVHSNGRHGAR